MIPAEDRGIKEFKLGPDGAGMKHILMTAIEGILTGLRCTLALFRQKKDEDIEGIRSRLHLLVLDLVEIK